MRLLAIRHGQASFGSDDYDRLSERGREQARRLGDWLAGHGERFERVLCGGMLRHRQTLDAIAEAYAERGQPLPATEFEPDFDEFDHHAVIGSFIAIEQAHPSVAAYRDGRADPAAVLSLLRDAFHCWAGGALDHCGEPWAGFRERTRAAGRRLHAGMGESSVLLVSSGGVLAQLAAAALEAPDSRAVELNLSLRNTALVEFHALPDGLRLGSWNALPHLADARELWTYY
jgi:broad specificity phosphatase PhoE